MKNITKSQIIESIEDLSSKCWWAGVSAREYTKVLTVCGLPPSDEYMDDRCNKLTIPVLKKIKIGLQDLLSKANH